MAWNLRFMKEPSSKKNFFEITRCVTDLQWDHMTCILLEYSKRIKTSIMRYWSQQAYPLYVTCERGEQAKWQKLLVGECPL